MAHCELCRTETDATVLYGGLCSVCEPWWNLVRDLVERTPSWQIEAMDDAAAMTDLDRVRDNGIEANDEGCLLYTSPSPRDLSTSRMPSSA